MKVLITENEIKKLVQKLASQLNSDYQNKKPLVVGILKGSIVFMSDLIRQLNFDLEIDFVTVSSYQGTQSSGKIKLVKDLNTKIRGKDVLIVEDIVDTGLTLKYLVKTLKSRKPKSVKVVTLLDKPSRRKTNFEADYVGETIEDYFVVGYGLDCDEKFRQLPYIAIYPSSSSKSRTSRDE